METNVVTFIITTSFVEWAKVYNYRIEMVKQATGSARMRKLVRSSPKEAWGHATDRSSAGKEKALG